ncbi:hypothetical protein V2J09_008340 [Rumex salicifolius]
MDGTNFMDEMECGNFFDQIDDLLEFPTDDLDTDLLGASGDFGSFPSTLPGSSSDALLSSDSVFSGSIAPDLSDQLSVPYEDIVQLEWLSNFVEDSFSGGGMTMEKQSNISSQSHQFQTSSPVSVLESSSSSSTGKSLPASHEKRARSKRPRPPTFTTNPNSIFIPCPPPVLGTGSTEPEPPKKTLNEPPKKKKKIKIVPPSNPADSNPNPNPITATQALRKCMHCEITKTPQWRAGPMGPKTLCNACGVRYKSGRLFPEYRPAASPTFIPSVHSNSHKKVIEMRTIKTCEDNVAMPTTPGDIERCNISI